MTTYALLNLAFLVIIGAGLAVYTRQRPKKALWCTLAVVLLMTAVFDSIFILLGLFEYEPETILGIYLWKAPIEDFAYSIASVGIIGLVWEYHESKSVNDK